MRLNVPQRVYPVLAQGKSKVVSGSLYISLYTKKAPIGAFF
uniref:Uncharacterized protein n=1 Tax=Vibrio tasmaniensis TaxID=212663 RepID=A0A0H3ZZX9_9VIBR|nr:hypothetical protein [Vibrio tasmaniensis]AKN40749.1 hypothetical protein [Vibrio tasmaniensis]